MRIDVAVPVAVRHRIDDCFGHLCAARAIEERNGVATESSPKGWEIPATAIAGLLIEHDGRLHVKASRLKEGSVTYNCDTANYPTDPL